MPREALVARGEALLAQNELNRKRHRLDHFFVVSWAPRAPRATAHGARRPAVTASTTVAIPGFIGREMGVGGRHDRAIINRSLLQHSELVYRPSAAGGCAFVARSSAPRSSESAIDLTRAAWS